MLFAAGTHVEYSTISDAAGNTSYPANCQDPTSNLYVAHVPSKTNAAANQLNGLTAAPCCTSPSPTT